MKTLQQRTVLALLRQRDQDAVILGEGRVVTRDQIKNDPALAEELYRNMTRGDFSRDIRHQFTSTWLEMNYLFRLLNQYGPGIGYVPRYDIPGRTPAEELVAGLAFNLRRHRS